MSRLCLSLLAIAFALALSGGMARADNDGDDDDTIDAIHQAVEAGNVRPLPELKAIIAGRFQGDIVRIEPHRSHGAFTYEFKVLQRDGRLIEIELDAATGRILKTENE